MGYPYKRFGRLFLVLLLGLLPWGVAGEPAKPSEEMIYARAVALASHGKEAESAELVRSLISSRDAGLSRRARLLLMLDERALFQYRAAFAAVEPLLDKSDVQLANRARLLKALADVPPEKADRNTPIRLTSFRTTASIGGKSLRFVVDTGASLSVLPRSLARAAGLRIRAVNYAIESALGTRLYADVAIGDLMIAATYVHNVVFLVLPDETLPSSMFNLGVVGLPVLRIVGPIDIFPKPARPTRDQAPMVFSNGTIGVEIGLRGIRVFCALDSGSNRSWFKVSSGMNVLNPTGVRKLSTVESAAGSERRISAYEAPIEYSIAGRSEVLHRALLVPPAKHDRNRPSCALGTDAITSLAPVSLDFGRMQIDLY